MWTFPLDESIFSKISKHAKTAGVIFMILGLVGIIFPTIMTMATVAFVSWLMLFAGISAAYFTWVSDKSDWLGWLKSILLVGASLFMLLYPMSGVGTVGLLLSIYFFMDAFAGFGLSSTQYPNKGWWAWLINALLSLALGVLFLINWPFSSLYLVGIYVGISLLFDGIALFSTGSFLNKIDKGEI